MCRQILKPWQSGLMVMQEVTSLQNERGGLTSMEEVSQAVAEAYAKEFNYSDVNHNAEDTIFF